MEKVIELKHEVKEGRFGEALRAVKTLAKLGAFYGAVCLALIAYDWSCVELEKLRAAVLIAELQRELGDFEIELDDKKRSVITPTTGTPAQVERALYLALLQLEIQSDALSNISAITSAQEVSGIKVVE